jgi:hypothetical protein
MAQENIPVRFHDRDLIWLKDDDGSGPLAPLEHIDDDGYVNVYDALYSDSYAHVFSDGSIRRYGEIVGRVDDLVLTIG